MGNYKEGLTELRAIANGYQAAADDALNLMWARKLGLLVAFSSGDGGAEEDEKDRRVTMIAAAKLWEALQPLLLRTPTDWTIFWRQLCEVPSAADETDEVILQLLAPAFYTPLEAKSGGADGSSAKRSSEEEWIGWLRNWLDALRVAHSRRRSADGGGGGMDGVAIGDTMRGANPKYIPREWMLAYAYEAAEAGNYEPLHELHQLLSRPYDEQPKFAERFYKRAPHGAEQQGGIGFMS